MIDYQKSFWIARRKWNWYNQSEAQAALGVREASETDATVMVDGGINTDETTASCLLDHPDCEGVDLPSILRLDLRRSPLDSISLGLESEDGSENQTMNRDQLDQTQYEGFRSLRDVAGCPLIMAQIRFQHSPVPLHGSSQGDRSTRHGTFHYLLSVEPAILAISNYYSMNLV